METESQWGKQLTHVYLESGHLKWCVCVCVFVAIQEGWLSPTKRASAAKIN